MAAPCVQKLSYFTLALHVTISMKLPDIPLKVSDLSSEDHIPKLMAKRGKRAKHVHVVYSYPREYHPTGEAALQNVALTGFTHLSL